MPVRIRRAAPGDVPAIAEIHALSWQDAYRGTLADDFLDHRVRGELLEQWRAAEIRDEDVLLVAVEAEAVGFIAVWCRPEPFIDNLHVLPARRSSGIGARLMGAAAEALIAQDKTTAHLWVFADNAGARRFYERLGGVAVERQRKAFFDQEAEAIKYVWRDLRSLPGPAA